MDLILGVVVWGGLLWLTLAVIGRAFGGGKEAPATAVGAAGRAAPQGTPGLTPATRSLHAPPVAARPRSARPLVPQESQRETEALVDGLIIGHFLTRGHYEDRLEELAAEEVPLDEFDAMGGFGVEPWYDDMFGDDGDDDG